jgi:hypothetical protein
LAAANGKGALLQKYYGRGSGGQFARPDAAVGRRFRDCLPGLTDVLFMGTIPGFAKH